MQNRINHQNKYVFPFEMGYALSLSASRGYLVCLYIIAVLYLN